MNQDMVISLAMQAMMLTLKVGGPILVVGLAIGLMISIFQAVTQIQEQTLSFIPKVAGLAVVIIAIGPWMLGQLLIYTTELWAAIPSMVGS